MTSETAQQRHDNILFLNRVVYDALNKKMRKEFFDSGFTAWYDGGESYEVMFRPPSITREEIARLKSAGLLIIAAEAYTDHSIRVRLRVNDINKVHGHINDGRKHVIPTR